jgi:predicted nucleotidyltransferase component of viral defense system
MIPNFYLAEWRQNVPWPLDSQVEQDLIISRALVNLYQQPKIQKSLLFRGGTALNKLFFDQSMRYSEDLDFVQISPEPIGEILNNVHHVLDTWLGQPKIKRTSRSVKLLYRYNSQESRLMTLKLEINITEHFTVLNPIEKNYSVNSSWFNGGAMLHTYQLNELIGTKLRALYQRRKGRDLFDLWAVLKNDQIDANSVINVYLSHCKRENQVITRKLFEQNFMEKKQHKDFGQDILSVISPDIQWDFEEACSLVFERLICLLP